MKNEYILRTFYNGASEIYCITTGAKSIRYNTGDVVYSLKGEPVAIKDANGYEWQHDDVDMVQSVCSCLEDLFGWIY